jgi:hypothetical protein
MEAHPGSRPGTPYNPDPDGIVGRLEALAAGIAPTPEEIARREREWAEATPEVRQVAETLLRELERYA